MLPSVFDNIKLAHERIDWGNQALTADMVSAQLIGPVPYWRDEEYAGMEPHEIERKILFDARRPAWAGISKHGKDYYQHFLALIRLMFPETDITPSLADAVMFFCKAVGSGEKKIVNLIGSQSSGKSAAACRLGFACMYVDPEYSAVFVANPFDNAADSTVWGDIEELWDQLCEYHPTTRGVDPEKASSLFPKGRKYANRQLDLVPDIPKAGSILLRNVKHVGKFKGSKGRGKDVTRGVMLLVVDEVNEIENPAFLTMLNNLVANDQFCAITSQNFKDVEDMGGRLTEPVGIYGGPASFDDLSLENDMWWHSAKSSVTLRFDGHKSPNILLGKTIYPKLFNAVNLRRMELDYGVQSPDYYSQVRSFPVRGNETNSVLSRAKISSSRHTDEFFTITSVIASVGFCDPAFGGRDKAMWGSAHVVNAVVEDGEGEQFDTQLLVFKEHLKSLLLYKNARFDEEWLSRMQRVGIETRHVTEGAEISYEDQIAIQCRELNKAAGVPPENFGYDFSMRPDIVSSMSKMVGFTTTAFDYNQAPEGVFLQNIKRNTEDCCKNRCTELAFLAADFFLTKQIRGGGFIETAITQLSRTLYETKNGKYVAEGKREYKARWQQVSPDHRDVLMGIAGMAVRRGFRQANINQGMKQRSVWDMVNERGLGKAKIARRF